MRAILALHAHLIKKKNCLLVGVGVRGACLRDIEMCLNTSLESPYHLGITAPVARTSMAEANERRDWRMSGVLGGHRRVGNRGDPGIHPTPAMLPGALAGNQIFGTSPLQQPHEKPCPPMAPHVARRL
jgi:hypothetical protein